MHLLARPDAGYDDFNPSLPNECFGKILYGRGRGSWDVDFAGFCPAQGGENRIDCLVERKQEPRHLWHRDRNGSAIANLLVEEWNNRATRRQNIAVPNTDKPR